MSKSVRRVERAALEAGLEITVRRMPEATRSAAEAAAACGCDIGQIVKSMVFEGAESGALKLVLVSGDHDLRLEHAREIFGEALRRAAPDRVRLETGFAIGGVAPIGHLMPLETWLDRHLEQFETVWAAAGAPNAVFDISPKALFQATRARPFDNPA